MDYPELVPLEGGQLRLDKRTRPFQPERQISLHTGRSCIKGPLKALRLVLLITIVPALFIFIPVYLRYKVFSGQMYPVAMTDMRMIDNRISTTWCETQKVRSNTTFNAFLLSEQPSISADLIPVTMTRYLTLEDDMKEYWGFYLLEGSVVTVSPCVRWPGASLTVIKGHKHLQDCAYIGDDSSEELEELLEANKLGLLNNATLLQRIKQLLNEDSPANNPDAMKIHKGGVRFHDPVHVKHESNTLIHTDPDEFDTPDVTLREPEELQTILERLYLQRRMYNEEKAIKSLNYRPPAHLMSLPALHRHRDTNIDRDERKWFVFKDLDGGEANNTSEEKSAKGQKIEKIDKIESSHPEDATTKNSNNTVKTVKSPENVTQPSQTSEELYDDIVSQLRSLGDRGMRVLQRLSQDTEKLRPPKGASTSKDSIELSEAKLEHLQNVLTEAIEEKKRTDEQREKRRRANEEARSKRELYIDRANFAKSLNDDDEERNAAIEEGADGFAEVHERVNETTPNDMSNSEFWSSFSSSEEALLECEGLILNLPLTPNPLCHSNGSDEQHSKAARQNAVTYRVPANGYYFFVFNSENEVQENYIRVRFDLQKTTYDLRRSLLECRNYSSSCDIPLRFLSAEKVVLEVPLRDNDSLWNEEFVVISECVPRTSIYLACAIAAPLLVVIFAFQ